MVKHPLGLRSEIARFVLGPLDAGGLLVLQTALGSEVATLELTSPAFGPPLDGVAVSNAIIPDMNATGGRVAKASFRDVGGVERFACSVSEIGEGGDIEMRSTEIEPGQTVRVRSVVYEAPA